MFSYTDFFLSWLRFSESYMWNYLQIETKKILLFSNFKSNFKLNPTLAHYTVHSKANKSAKCLFIAGISENDF